MELELTLRKNRIMSKRLLILDNASNCLDMAIRAKLSGWDIRWWDRPRPDGSPRLAGMGMIDKIQDFNEIKRKWLDWADLIYLPDNVLWTDMLEPYRLQGYPILAPSPAAAALELDRDAGQKAMKKAGIPIMKTVEFHDYDSAIAFVKKNPAFLVSKPSGDANKALSYVAHDPADLVYMLTRWKNNPALKSAARSEGFILQERKYGVEMAVGGFFGPHGFGQYFYENWEYKKLMADDLGVNTGEMGCYDDKTEVLTENGWKFWPDVTMEDKLATLVNGVTVFELPSAVVKYDYDGDMVCWNNQTLDIMVTPNHNMYVNKQSSALKKKDENYEFILAENCTDFQYEIQRTSEWCGESDDFYVIPERKCYKQTSLTRAFPMIEWARFMGVAVAEGWFGDKNIIIAQSHPIKMQKVRKVIVDAGLEFIKVKNGFAINSTQIAQHFKNFGRAWEKKVPEFIKNGTTEVITAFLEGYALGDGNMQENGFRIFYTTSKLLADDVQELLLKIGRVGIIKERDRIGKSNIAPDGHLITSRRISYEIIERVKKTRSWLDKRDRSLVHYSGKVYCATVSSHILYVRRNGKPLWCGNTLSRIVKKSKLADIVLKPIEEQLHKIGYVGYVDNNCIIDDKGIPWPMEYTMRDGWPTKHNVTAHVKNEDPVQWMLDLVNGKDTMECIDGEVCVSVLIALPDFPYSKITNKELCGIPIRGANDMKHIHLSEAMMGIAPTMVGDKVVDQPGLVTCGDYVMVVTGTGDTITAARKDCYTAVKKVKIPNNMMYRNDIGAGRMKKHLPLLHKMGYGKGLEF